MVFVDSHIPMYVAGLAHPLRDRARRFLDRVRRGDVTACTNTAALAEITSRYDALGRRDLATAVYDLFVEVCPVILPVTLADTDRARALLAVDARIGPRQALHAAVMLNHDIARIATFDERFDRFPGLTRVQMS
jgi:predicted nucleic acid-binding protein